MSTPSLERAELLAAVADELGRVSSLSVLFSQAVAERVGMNPTDLETLDVLHRSGPIPAGRLAELTGLTTGAVTGLVDRLERRGYVRREPDPSDRRRVIVRPLPENAARDLGPFFASIGQAMNELAARYGDEELAVILDFMRRAGAIASAQITKVRADATADTERRPHPAAED
jgi:DNA-binding MarR family transcriptional regulator